MSKCHFETLNLALIWRRCALSDNSISDFNKKKQSTRLYLFTPIENFSILFAKISVVKSFVWLHLENNIIKGKKRHLIVNMSGLSWCSRGYRILDIPCLCATFSRFVPWDMIYERLVSANVTQVLITSPCKVHVPTFSFAPLIYYSETWWICLFRSWLIHKNISREEKFSV